MIAFPVSSSAKACKLVSKFLVLAQLKYTDNRDTTSREIDVQNCATSESPNCFGGID